MRSPVNEIVLTVLSLVIALVAAVAGLYLFLSRYQYAEVGHDYLVMGYVASCFILFFAVRLWNIPLFVIAVLVLGGVQTYSQLKFSWRENYIESAKAGKPFALEEYIDKYPTYEEHVFRILKAPDWVRFNEDCVQPALAASPVKSQCATLESINDTYNLDVKRTMVSHYARMRSTAKQIQAGKLSKRSAYVTCLAAKTCATIPLLPKNVDANKVDPTSRDYIEVRTAFWSLINDKRMSSEVCNLNPLCKSLVAMNAVDPLRLPF